MKMTNIPYQSAPIHPYCSGMARNEKNSVLWSAGRVCRRVTYSFSAQKLVKAKNARATSGLTETARKKTAAITHQAFTRAESSVQSLCGAVLRRIATDTLATASSPATRTPVRTTGSESAKRSGIVSARRGAQAVDGRCGREH